MIFKIASVALLFCFYAEQVTWAAETATFQCDTRILGPHGGLAKAGPRLNLVHRFGTTTVGSSESENLFLSGSVFSGSGNNPTNAKVNWAEIHLLERSERVEPKAHSKFVTVALLVGEPITLEFDLTGIDKNFGRATVRCGLFTSSSLPQLKGIL